MLSPTSAQSRIHSPSTDVVLTLSGVGKSFGAVHAVRDVDLEVNRNELVTLLGPSGCGKTTTLRMIAGFEFPTRGQIRIDGSDVTYTPPNKREIGIVFQSYSLFPHLKVGDNVGYGLKRRGVGGDERRRRVHEALELVDLAGYVDRYPSELSGGQQQRVALARAIVIRPKILLLDEPLSALDAKLRQRMRFEIRELQRRIGMTTVLVTHDQEEALAMSDRIVVMNGGRIEQTGSPGDIYRAPATQFVASFVGETNLFRGAVGEAAPTPGFSIFTAEDGFEACVRNETGLDSGQPVLMSLRPEALSIKPVDAFTAGSRNMLQGEITGVSYLGSRTVVQVRTGASLLYVSVPNDVATAVPGSLRQGERVTVSWAHESCRVIKAA